MALAKWHKPPWNITKQNMGADIKVMNYAALRERSIQNLSDFLNTEVDLGMTFASLASRQRDTGNFERYEISKRKAFAALDAIDYFKHRLRCSLRTQIETRRLELIETLSRHAIMRNP